MEVNELNPYLVLKFVQTTTLRKTKTDKLDALAITRCLMTNVATISSQVDSLSQELKVLTRMRADLIADRSKILVKLTNSLDRVFPEFKPHFKVILGKTALSLLAKVDSTVQIAKLTNTQIEKLHNLGLLFSVDKLFQLNLLASKSFGVHSPAEWLVIHTSLRQHDVVQQSIKSLEVEITTIMKQINSPLASLPGVGLFSAAVIHAEYGDFKRFVNSNKLLAYASLECPTIQSGTSEYRGKMVKRCSPSLRFALMNVAVSVKNHYPTFSAYFHKKFNDEHKHYRVALCHVVRKLLRVMHYMVITNTVYDSSLSN